MSKHSLFTVKGKPFFPVGGQAHNSTSYVLEDLKVSFNAVKKLNGNSLAVTICWDRFEAAEGVFDRKYVTDIIQMARNENIKLVILWFGSWKNGIMGYCPPWVKNDTKRFKRVLSGDRKPVFNLSCHCPANYEADGRAFAELCATIRDFDAEEQTVIGIQVQNEAGHFGGARRDFRPEATIEFESDVPKDLIEYMKGLETGRPDSGYKSSMTSSFGSSFNSCSNNYPSSCLIDKWVKSGHKQSGNWIEIFGRFGAEAFTAYTVAKYINYVAGEGRKQYDIFMYVNVALDGGSRGEDWEIPGISYFAGGPVPKVRDIYYHVCDNIDALCPDDYKTETMRHKEVLDFYTHPEAGWPLYVPESGTQAVNTAHMMYAAADLGAIGYHIFGVESSLDRDGNLRPSSEGAARSFLMLKNMAPLLARYRNTSRIKGIYQYTGEAGRLLEFDNWKCYVSYIGLKAYNWGNVGSDYRHDETISRTLGDNMMDFEAEKGRGILIQTGDDEFYMVGHAFHLFFNEYEPMDGSIPNMLLNPTLQVTGTEYVDVTEGHFDENMKYVVDRVRSGDENWRGTWAAADCGVIRFTLHRNG